MFKHGYKLKANLFRPDLIVLVLYMQICPPTGVIIFLIQFGGSFFNLFVRVTQ